MTDAEKAKVMAESGSSLRMEPKVQKMMELNSLREKLSEKFFEDNKGSVTFFGVGMDPNDCPAIQIGVPPEVDQNSLKIPEGASCRECYVQDHGMANTWRLPWCLENSNGAMWLDRWWWVTSKFEI